MAAIVSNSLRPDSTGVGRHLSQNTTSKLYCLFSERCRQEQEGQNEGGGGVKLIAAAAVTTMISQFNGTSTPKGSYSAKTGVNYPVSSSSDEEL